MKEYLMSLEFSIGDLFIGDATTCLNEWRNKETFIYVSPTVYMALTINSEYTQKMCFGNKETHQLPYAFPSLWYCGFLQFDTSTVRVSYSKC